MKDLEVELTVRWAVAKEQGDEIECYKIIQMLKMLGSNQWG